MSLFKERVKHNSGCLPAHRVWRRMKRRLDRAPRRASAAPKLDGAQAGHDRFALRGSRLPPTRAPHRSARLYASAAILVAGIVGATLMPRAIHLRESFTQSRARLHHERERRATIRVRSAEEGVVAPSFAGIVNRTSSVCNRRHSGVGEIGAASHTRVPPQRAAGTARLLTTAMVSGTSSSAAGSPAGPVVRLPL